MQQDHQLRDKDSGVKSQKLIAGCFQMLYRSTRYILVQPVLRQQAKPKQAALKAKL